MYKYDAMKKYSYISSTTKIIPTYITIQIQIPSVYFVKKDAQW